MSSRRPIGAGRKMRASISLRLALTAGGSRICAEHVALEVDAGRNLDHFQAARGQPEHAALGDVQRRLAALAPRSAPLKVRCSTSSTNLQRRALAARSCSAPSSISTCRSPAVKVPTNTTFFAFWLMLMKPPAPARRGPNLLDVQVAVAVGLRQAEEGDVQAAAVVEVELGRLVDDGVGVGGRAEVRGRRPECRRSRPARRSA